MTKTKYPQNLGVGCYVDASCQSADDCNERTIAFAASFGFQTAPVEQSEDYSEVLSEVADEAVNWLNEQETRSYMAWTFEDNSLFLVADVDMAKEDVGFVSSREQDYPDDDYEGEWLHVSDHGNATLYVRENGKDTEIWSVV